MLKQEIPKRPFQVTLLAAFTLVIALCNGLRFWQAIAFWTTLSIYGDRPLYETISGGLWFIGGLILFYGLCRGYSWSLVLSVGVTISYGIYYWLDRLLLQMYRANWPFSVIISCTFLFLFFFLLLSKPTRQYCSKRHP
jgi:hypothetical protein